MERADGMCGYVLCASFVSSPRKILNALRPHRARYFQPGSPGLYLRATGDRLVTKAAADAFAKTAVNARVVDIEGPHLLLQTNPIDTARVLRAFIHEASADHSENR